MLVLKSVLPIKIVRMRFQGNLFKFCFFMFLLSKDYKYYVEKSYKVITFKKSRQEA